MKDNKRLLVIFTDAAYKRNNLPQWIADELGVILQPVLRPVNAEGFVLLPKRWIVGRTFAWLGRYRRNSKDYEKLTSSSETMLYLSMTHNMLKILENKHLRV